ncbi:MAG: LPS-assembly protein LptD [Candidatus Rokuibacteriota bacterium]
MPGTRPIWVVVALLSMLPVIATGQERRELAIGAESPVSVFADRLESLERDNLVIAEGNVEIEQGEVRLQADRVEMNTETGEAVAVGRVVFFDGRDRLIGERLEYNFRTGTGIVYRAEGFAEPHFFFGGDRMERLGEKAYRLTGGTFTTCEGEPPAWHIRWGQATAYLDDFVWGRNASFWVWKIPLVPFIPIFSASLRKDRHTGLLAPSIGTSNTKGFTVGLPFYWAISDSQDLTLVPTFYEQRGFGLGAAYRYVRRETSRGEVEGFGLYDTEQSDLRGVFGLRHEELVTPSLTLRADIATVSDDLYFREFGNTLDERSRQRLESNVSLTNAWARWNLFGRLFFYEDLTTEAPIELHRLPEIRLNGFPQPLLPWLPDALFELEGSYNNFVRDLGSDGQRLDARPRVSYPVSPGGFFTVTPRLAVRETVYDTTVVGTTVDRGFTVEETRADFTHRTLLEAGMDTEARAYRIFEMGGAFGIQRLQHVIEPRISYNFISDVEQSDLPQFDGLDRIPATNGVTYSLTNRVKARALGTDERPGQVWELFRFTLSQTYDLEERDLLAPGPPINFPAPPPPAPDAPLPPPAAPIPIEQRRLTDVFADLIFEPVFGIRFRGTATVDPYEARLTSATTDAIYQTETWLAAVGTRHGFGGRLSFVQGTLHARLSRRWAVRFATNYDVETNTVIENRLEVDFREQCWAITAALVDRTDEDEFHLTVNLLELGQYGFGRAFSGTQ